MGGRSKFRSLLDKRSIEKIIILELEEGENTSLIEKLFELIPTSINLRKLREITFNVFDDELILYGNIKFCSELREITLVYFDLITPTFVKIFKNLIGTLKMLKNPFSLNITKREVLYENIDTTDEIYKRNYDAFEQYVNDLDDGYFGTIEYVVYQP